MGVCQQYPPMYDLQHVTNNTCQVHDVLMYVSRRVVGRVVWLSGIVQLVIQQESLDLAGAA